MISNLAQVVRQKRIDRDIKLVRIGAAVDRSEGSVSRFETGVAFQEVDAYVTAYAEELDVEPIEIWEAALKEWRSS